jgi:hypothetical protein
MAAISGTKASVKLTGSTPTTSLAQAFTTVSATEFKISDAAKRHWDPDSTGTGANARPRVMVNGSTVGVGAWEADYVRGRITFDSAPGGTVTADVAYLSASALGLARQWQLGMEASLYDGSVFGSTWRQVVPGMRSATVQLGGFWTIGGGSTDPLAYDYINLSQKVLVELYPSNAAGDRYEAFGYLNTDQVQTPFDGLIGESVGLTIDGTLHWTTST